LEETWPEILRVARELELLEVCRHRGGAPQPPPPGMEPGSLVICGLAYRCGAGREGISIACVVSVSKNR
jgi:hypothetical protein